MSMRIRCWRFSCGTVRVHANTEPCTGDRGSKRASLFEFHISELPSSRQFMHRKPQRSQAVNHWQNGDQGTIRQIIALPNQYSQGIFRNSKHHCPIGRMVL
ncbi:hypothetical protein AcW1_004572 [Taiwanofungus camphoratus]|nr:hypothetical protein AcV5_000957 [Antrodia cinnamomea]KAI0959877.1 hypothetical protein AcW1_004572 [Antrodia cinnamomea]